MVGVVVLAVGIGSLVGLVAGLIAGDGRFDPGILLIGTGIGLLRGSSLQRSIFGGILALALVVTTVVVIVNSVYKVGYWGSGLEEQPRFLWGWAVLPSALLRNQ